MWSGVRQLQCLPQLWGYLAVNTPDNVSRQVRQNLTLYQPQPVSAMYNITLRNKHH